MAEILSLNLTCACRTSDWNACASLAALLTIDLDQVFVGMRRMKTNAEIKGEEERDVSLHIILLSKITNNQ